MAKNDKKEKTNKEKNHFFKDYRAELKKVIWPTSKQLVNTTIAIITMVIVVSVIVFGLDLVFDAMNKYGLTKLQETVQNIENNKEDSSKNEDATDNLEDSVELTDGASTVEGNTEKTVTDE